MATGQVLSPQPAAGGGGTCGSGAITSHPTKQHHGLGRIATKLSDLLHSIHLHHRRHHHDHHDHHDDHVSEAAQTNQGNSKVKQIQICHRCHRPFTAHRHTRHPSGLFYRDKCNYYHPGSLKTAEEIVNLYGRDSIRAARVRHLGDGKEKMWSCCLLTDAGHGRVYGGCSFSSGRHFVEDDEEEEH